MQGRILPLLCAIAEQDAGQNRSNDDGEGERPQQRKGHRPSHRFEQPTLDGLQCKDRQVNGYDDGNRVKDWALHFVRCFTNLLSRRPRVVWMRKMADDVLDHHHRPIHHHAEVQRAQ